MAGVVPSDAVIRVLNPIVKTGEYPVNQAAVKMLTKVAENKESQEVVIDHLGDIMPGLLRVIFIFSLPYARTTASGQNGTQVTLPTVA